VSERKPIRLWPFIAIVALLVLAQLLIWFGDAGNRQIMVMKSMGAGVLAVILTTVWALAFSRLPGRLRLRIAGGLVLVLLVGVSSLKIRGFSGDLVPILDWRWASSEAGEIITSGRADRVDKSDSPQFLGPNRNARIEGTELKDWSTHPPREVWRIKIGDGWSAFAVSGNQAITQEQRDEFECVVSYDLNTGQQQWIHKDVTRYATAIAGIGPRATPTIRGNHVYTAGATGQLNCLDLETGRVIWQRNFVTENKASIMTWGNAGSPLLLGNRVIINAGGKPDRALVAYDAETGDYIWGAGNNKAGYSSPSLHKVAGMNQILIFNSGAVNGHHPETGKVLWSMPWGPSECVAQPLPLSPNRIFVSSGYGVGCTLYEISQNDGEFSADIVWKTSRMKAKFTNVVHHEGYIYGLDDGVLVCLDPADGQRKWKQGRYGHGQILLVGDKLIVQTEDGDVLLIDPNPGKLIELGRIPALDSKTWNNPTLAGSLLLVRNDREAVCYEVATGRDEAI
jgi:outer membrane protein assembly factor BamB